ncbi:hypothetical protein D3C78_1039370 [compost metagenome]
MSTRLFRPVASLRKKPSLLSWAMRLLKSPAAAASTSCETSCSVRYSSVRSVHCTAEPRRSPASLNTGTTSRPKRRPPRLSSARWTPVRRASICRWCAGFLWNMSILAPISLLALKLGSCLRMSASARLSISVTVRFM